MIRITDIIDKIHGSNPDADTDLVDRAYIYSARVHAGQVRLSGEPYLHHPLEVAYILADMNLDITSVAAGLLHDVIEDTKATEEDIREVFGEDVVHIVSGLTKLSKVSFSSLQARQAESIRKMLLAMSNDIRVILIKLADRLHNMRTLQFHKSERKKMKISQETLDIFAPLASRLGIYWIKRELEDTAFKYLDIDSYQKIEALVAKDKEERENYIETIKSRIKDEMERADLKCKVIGRYKHFYSIYQKMVSQRLEFSDVYDIIAFRIILDTKAQCYEALGLIHSLWKPIDRKFKDYVARPKSNMYQSLHTTVIGPYGDRIEIQIRTRDMDWIAKSGIAAHWGYKEGKSLDETVTKKFAWIQELIENQENTSDPDEFMENVRMDLFPDDIYVFTPMGEIKSMPKGATPVDFAYMIHSEVGHWCTGAKVNGAMVPLRHELKTGDVVEIITTKGHNPSRDWLKFVKTVKSRSRIRQWIKTQEKERSITLGRELCEKEFRKYKLNYNERVKTEEMQKVAEDFGLKSIEDLIANVGYGKITPLQIVRKFQPKQDEQSRKNDSIFNKLMGRVKKKKHGAGVIVKGIDDMLVKFGKCCQPVPGDPVTGYITRGYGVTVHKRSCVNALKISPERRIEVEWDSKISETYPVRISVHSNDRVGLLADLAANISKKGANILNVSSETRENKTVVSLFTIAVENTGHLNTVLTALRRVKTVHNVKRLGG